jgi:hypothetical protein
MYAVMYDNTDRAFASMQSIGDCAFRSSIHPSIDPPTPPTAAVFSRAFPGTALVWGWFGWFGWGEQMDGGDVENLIAGDVPSTRNAERWAGWIWVDAS